MKAWKKNMYWFIHTYKHLFIFIDWLAEPFCLISSYSVCSQWAGRDWNCLCTKNSMFLKIKQLFKKIYLPTEKMNGVLYLESTVALIMVILRCFCEGNNIMCILGKGSTQWEMINRFCVRKDGRFTRPADHLAFLALCSTWWLMGRNWGFLLALETAGLRQVEQGCFGFRAVLCGADYHVPTEGNGIADKV